MAGIRYRARRLSETLHPTVPVHAPLVFDLIDTWRERSIARCTYYVAKPDGTLYTARPANAAEAEERRRERFLINDHTSGEILIPEEETNPIFPITLDLRIPKPGAVPAYAAGQP